MAMCGQTSCPDIVARLIVRANDRSAARTSLSDVAGAGTTKPESVSARFEFPDGTYLNASEA
jgi:hypothetical protein